jgi:coenzyme F420-0:L-glutamate ligase/coenzyme F420-1:gamma-L-glutamate ligase
MASFDLISGRNAVDDAITCRRSIRRFLPDEIPADSIRALIEIVQWAPSPHNSQPWRFVILSPATKHTLGSAMAARLFDALRDQGLSEPESRTRATHSMNRIDNAPSAIITCLSPDGLALVGNDELDGLERTMAVQSVGAALQSLFLVAAERGIGACWMAAPMYCPDTVNSVLALPKDWSPQALVLMGYPADDGRVRPRRPLASVVLER